MCEPVGLPQHRQRTDHRGDRVTDERDAVEIEFAHDVEHVFGVGVERGVPVDGVRVEVGPAVPHVVEEHDAVRVGERRRHEPPHVLITAVAVREQHRRAAPETRLGDRVVC
jgi:hypothetical protein